MLNIYVRMEMGGDDKVVRMWYKKMTMVHIVAGGLSVILNRIRRGNYEAKEKVFKEQGLSKDTAYLSSISKGGTSYNFGRRY